jgi:Heavy-metal resistance
MINTLKLIALCAISTTAMSAFGQHSGHQHGTASHASPPSTYAGEQTRSIKALSASETKSWLDGLGMGLARAAELNGYPGPMHVLELRRPLRLTDTQQSATEELMRQHKAEVRSLGGELVNVERRLDIAFADKSITPETLTSLTRRIGELQAQIRDSHLQTHLKQTALLSSEQVVSYASLRGYTK